MSTNNLMVDVLITFPTSSIAFRNCGLGSPVPSQMRDILGKTMFRIDRLPQHFREHNRRSFLVAAIVQLWQLSEVHPNYPLPL